LPVLDPFHPSVVNFVKDPEKLYEGISYSSFENNKSCKALRDDCYVLLSDPDRKLRLVPQ
ncbi:unnamed protein product, partial [Pocillopora meandrina]